MASPSTAHEPSMEEILASIRQIISEDGDEPAAPDFGAEPQGPEKPRNSGTVQDIGAEERSSAKPQAVNGSIPAAAKRSGAEPMPVAAQQLPSWAAKAAPANTQASSKGTAPEPAAPAGRVHRDEPRQPAPDGDYALLSPGSKAAVSGAFNALTHTILAQNARTLEDLVSEMLRPMLTEWLDENLPSLVERLVKEEIERVSRGRR